MHHARTLAATARSTRASAVAGRVRAAGVGSAPPLRGRGAGPGGPRLRRGGVRGAWGRILLWVVWSESRERHEAARRVEGERRGIGEPRGVGPRRGPRPGTPG